MKSIKTKHIVITLVIAFILYFLFWDSDDDFTNEYPGASSSSQSHSSNPSFDDERSYSSSQPKTQSNLNRQEVLKKNVKGYREATYWGAEHPTYEKTKNFSDDEFKRFMKDEIEEKDADLYWGAEY